jgi:hypothetical protein
MTSSRVKRVPCPLVYRTITETGIVVEPELGDNPPPPL